MRNRYGCGCAGIDAFGSPAGSITRLGQSHRRMVSEGETRVHAAAPEPVGPCATLGADAKRQAGHDGVGPGAGWQCRDCESGELLLGAVRMDVFISGSRFWAQFGRNGRMIPSNTLERQRTEKPDKSGVFARQAFDGKGLSGNS